MKRLARLLLSVLSTLSGILAVVLGWSLWSDSSDSFDPRGLFWLLTGLALPAWLLVFAPLVLLLRPDALALRMSRLPVIGALTGALVAVAIGGPLAYLTPFSLLGPLVGALSGFTYSAVNALMQEQEQEQVTVLVEHPPEPALPAGQSSAPPLTVLYDASCGLCYRARRWLEAQDLYVPILFVATNSVEAKRRFPTLDHELSKVDVTVVGPAGEVWRGAEAWLMCLWATWTWRGLSQDLATPNGLKRARQFIDTLSGQRHRVSAALRLKAEECGTCGA